MCEVSIIIVCMNRPDNLYPCLASIRETTSADYETLVVAYMYDKEALAKAREDFPWVTFIENDSISGFSENNNLALAQASGRYCFILNDDTELPGPTIDRLLEDIRALPDDTAIVSPKMLNSDGSLQLLGRPPYPAWNYVRQQWHRYSEPKDNTSGRTPDADVAGRALFRTWGITGAAFLIKTEVFRDLGWFDERYFFTPEDIALGAAVCRKGLTIYVDRDAAVYHHWRTTASRMMAATRPAAVRGSLMYFSGFRTGKYLLLAVPVWCAEFAKRLKAFAIATVMPSDKHYTDLTVYRNITRSIFTRRTPKQIFTKYYNRIKLSSKWQKS